MNKCIGKNRILYSHRNEFCNIRQYGWTVKTGCYENSYRKANVGWYEASKINKTTGWECNHGLEEVLKRGTMQWAWTVS